ncbi:amidohydrolase [Shimia sediminis]|uniref:amidohydrolase n=1 Tax=Shimia sediminis TaxID=2497945 RepID=UPI000F8C34BC|nr:amidohydrolase [Shimia sediminis]
MAILTQAQIATLTSLRHELHRRPESSGEERETAKRIRNELIALGADQIWQRLGGHGVAAAFDGATDGPTVLLRCELDGLPIHEISDIAHKSEIEGRGHLCGHDGHMASMLGVAMALAIRPTSGRVILLFQPAEETGAGAKSVMEDPRWPEIRPDYAFAYHNVPGRPLGEIGLRPGPGNCASRGMQILLEGKSSHAAAPEDGVSPGATMASLMHALPALSAGTIADGDFALATLTHAQLGDPTFGIAPGRGELRVTLRCMTDARMDLLVCDALSLVERYSDGLSVSFHWHDVFLSVTNDPEATDIARQIAQSQCRSLREMPTPMRWSEDFGRIGGDGAKAAMIYVGAGENHPQLHNPDYDFPDALIPIVIDLFSGIIDAILGRAQI